MIRFIVPHAIKSVKQSFISTEKVVTLMTTFRQMVNHCIRIGLENDASTLKRLSKLAYGELAGYDIISYYKLCAISHAAGILANRKKSLKRNREPRRPYATKPLLLSCYGFKVVGGILRAPLGNAEYFGIPLNSYVRKLLSDPSIKIRSFTLTADSLSICYSKEVTEIECASLQGVDRNLRNLTIGNCQQVKHYDLSKTIDIAENTRSIIKSFKRNDSRIRKQIYSKYGRRSKNRINQLLHHVSKAVVQRAKESRTAFAFEDIRHIRRLYKKGNYQGPSFRGRLNGWPFAEIKRQISYKAAWEGVPFIQLSLSETRFTSQLCPRCRKKFTQGWQRQLWCGQCRRWMDRDVVAVMNLSIKGLARFASPKGLAGEAMVQESGSQEPVILKVDASKLIRRHKPTS